MVVPRTPRPPIVTPKPTEPPFDPSEVERWIRRLARAIRLRRLEQGFLGAQREIDLAGSERALNPAASDIAPQRR
jgi:hypothetical protein